MLIEFSFCHCGGSRRLSYLRLVMGRGGERRESNWECTKSKQRWPLSVDAEKLNTTNVEIDEIIFSGETLKRNCWDWKCNNQSSFKWFLWWFDRLLNLIISNFFFFLSTRCCSYLSFEVFKEKEILKVWNLFLDSNKKH